MERRFTLCVEVGRRGETIGQQVLCHRQPPASNSQVKRAALCQGKARRSNLAAVERCCGPAHISRLDRLVLHADKQLRIDL